MTTAEIAAIGCASVLHDTVLSRALGASHLACLEELGEEVVVPAGAAIFAAGEPSHFLYAVLDGVLVPEPEQGAAPAYWIGPGDVCGEIGFVLGSERNTTVRAFGGPARVWRIHRDVLAQRRGDAAIAAGRLVAALSTVVRARLEALPRRSDRTEAEYCNHRHPSVAAMAAGLARETPAESAGAVWAAVWRIPYRFGSWQWSASETLARGHGMCTTKAVLQVALLRALGIEAGYVHGALSGPLVRACMPRAYHERFDRRSFKHYFAAARLDGRWVPLDASFSRASLALIAETEASVAPFVEWNGAEAGYANGIASMSGTDPFAVEVHADMPGVMSKTPSYDGKNADAMNVLLDRAQGYAPRPPRYVAAMERLFAARSWQAGLATVLTGFARDAAMLRRARDEGHRPVRRPTLRPQALAVGA